MPNPQTFLAQREGATFDTPELVEAWWETTFATDPDNQVDATVDLRSWQQGRTAA